MKKTFLSLLSLMVFATGLMAQKTKIKMETSEGTIVLMLYDNTPKHRDNFIKLVKEHFYDGTLFHRVIPEFMIQGGDPKSKTAGPGDQLGSGDVGYTIPAEINDADYHKRGALAAARDNNPAKNSSGCQFYIVVGKKVSDAELDGLAQRSGRTYTPAQREVYKTQGGTAFLDGNYTVFGEVVSGMDVVDKIVMAPRAPGDRPNNNIKMTKVTIMK